MTSLPLWTGYSAAGMAIGALVGLTGVGGGSLMTPLLILLFGITPSSAIGTDLLFAAVTKAAGTAVHGRMRTVDWRVTGLLAAGSLPMTVVTLGVLAWAGPPARSLNHGLATALGVALLVTAVSVAGRPLLHRMSRGRGGREVRHAAAWTVVLGVVLGVLVPLTSVGSAALGMPLLVLLYPERPTARLVGADVAHAVPLTLVAGLGHLLLGAMDWGLLSHLLLGSIPGVVIGSLLAGKVPDGALRLVLGAALVLAGLRLLT